MLKVLEIMDFPVRQCRVRAYKNRIKEERVAHMKTLTRLILAVVYIVAMQVVPVGFVRADEMPEAADRERQEELTQLDALLSVAGEAVTVPSDQIADLNGLKAQLEHLQEALSSRDQELKSSDAVLTEAEARLKNVQDENHILKDEIERQHRRVEQAEAARRQVQEDFERLFKEDAKTGIADDANAGQAAQIEKLKVELAAALERQPDPVANGADGARVRELEAAVEEMKDVDAQRRAAMDDLFKQLAAHKRDVATRDQALAETQTALEAEKARVADRERELAARGETIAARQSELATRQQQLETLEGTLAEARRQTEATAAGLADRETELKALRGELEQVKLVDAQRRKTLDETLASLATAEQRVTRFSAELDVERTQHTVSAQETAARMATLTSRNALLEVEITRMERDVKTAQADREAALAQVADVRNTLTASDATVVELEAQVARLSAVDTQRRKAMDQILMDTAILEQDNAKLMLKVQQLASASAERKTEVTDAPESGLVEQVRSENTALQSRIAELERLLQVARETTTAVPEAPVPPTAGDGVAAALASVEQAGWQQDKQRLDAQLSELRATATQDAERIETMTRELSQAQQKALELETRVKDLEGRKTDVRDSDLFKELEQINAMLREKMLEVEADRQRLARLAEAAAKTEVDQAKTIETHTARLAAMDTALTEAQAREEEYKELIERLVPQVATLEQQSTALAQERQVLTNRLLQHDQDLQTLKVELERREHRLAKAERVADVLEKARTEVLRAGDREKLNMHYNMASVYARDGKFAEAENEYLQALRIDPADADVHYNLGILYDDEMKQPEKAMVHYRRYLQLNPHGPDADHVRTWLMKLEMQAQR